MDDELKNVKRIERTLSLIRRQPGITATLLNRATNYMNEYCREQVLEQLAEEGEIRVEIVKPKGKGRPSKLYWPKSPVTQGATAGSVPAPRTTTDVNRANKHVLHNGQKLTLVEYVKATGKIARPEQLIDN